MTSLKVAILVLVVLIQGSIACRAIPKGVGTSHTAESDLQRCSGRPRILARNEWGAKNPMGDMKRHSPNRITIHHTASRQRHDVSLQDKMRSLQKFSQNSSKLANGDQKLSWPDVPYHFYVSVDGQIAEGRNINFVGDTNTDYDPTGHVLLVLEGSFDEEQPSSMQLDSLRCLVRWVGVNWHIPTNTIKGHKDYASTACPGKNLQKELHTLSVSQVNE
jgi:hypothetical protein